jgi:hypothetical protein
MIMTPSSTLARICSQESEGKTAGAGGTGNLFARKAISGPMTNLLFLVKAGLPNQASARY